MSLHQQQVHPIFIEDCFGCKASTIQLSAGDADSNKAMSNRKWNGELDAYAEARRQGIQPAGTRMGQIKAAVEASDTIGRAYDAGTMPAAHQLTKSHGEVMKEVGI
jgi:hypothetical protein